MTSFDARAMLGLYCYRSGYYPAALAQWTRIPERNRALRPVIANLLDEVDNRLALEKQETQPMRRDQIMQQQPIFSGNLSPADLPNPHEPVSHEETEDGHREAWDGHQSSSYALDSDDEEERQITVSLSGERGDTAPVGSSNGHSVSSSLGNGRSQSSIMLGSLQRPAPPSRTRPNWLMRLLRPSSNK